MAATVLFEIKKKRRCPSTKKSPFPLVFHLGCDKSSIVTWQFYHGILKPDGVEVTSKEDMKNLYNMGYFGKGTLSRSAPRFYGDGEENDEPRMMSLHRYERHKKLRAEADAGGSPRPAGNADSSNVVLVKLETEEESKESSNDVTVVSATGFDRPVPRILARGKKSLKRARDTSGDSAKDDTAAATSSQRCGDNKTGATDVGAENDDESSEQTGEKNKTCGVATEDDDEGPDIYECDSSGERILGVEDTVVAAPSAEVEEGADDASDDIIELDSRTGMEVTRTNKDVPLKKENMADDEGGSKLAEKDKVTPEGKACTSAATGSNESGNNDNPAREEPASGSVDSGTDVPDEVTLVTDVSEVEELDCKIGVREIDLATKERSDGGQSSGQTRSKRQKRSESDEEETAVDSDVEEVELIREKAAADDSSSGTEPEYFAAEDPWPITESLQLLFEEAYFLSYGLGCLIVKDGDEDLELLKLWRRLCTLCDNFPARYATYHHFRSKGWVVRSGMKYAADYLLYKDGPPFYHASFSVIVRRVHADTLEEEPDHRLQTWQGLSGLIRVNGNASKTVLLCHVIMPKEADLTTPRCLQSFTIQELLVRRWVVSEEREKRDDAS